MTVERKLEGGYWAKDGGAGNARRMLAPLPHVGNNPRNHHRLISDFLSDIASNSVLVCTSIEYRSE